MSESKIEGYFFVTLLVLVMCVVGIMFFPFIGAIATAIVLATLTYPVHEWILRRVKSPSVSALISTLVITLALLVPATGVLYLMVDELQGIAHSVSSQDIHIPDTLITALNGVYDSWPALHNIDIVLAVQHMFESLGSTLAGMVLGTADALVQVFLTVLILYFFLKDGRFFLLGLIRLSPLKDEEDVLIVKKLQLVSVSLIRGTLVIAMLQGLLTGIGLYLFGVPNPVLWGCVSALSALVPTIGIGLVTLPAIIFLAVSGEFVSALGFTAWAALIAGMVDNVLGPKLIGSKAKIHPLFILLSVLGGLVTFGPAGFLIGPLLFGLAVALSEIYVLKIRALHAQS
jgi:predicted PurR-regulated permease PerM